MHCLKFTLWRWRNIPGTTDGQFLVIQKGIKHICGVLKPWTNLVENSSEICCIKWDNFGVMARLVVLGKPGISLDRMEMKEANFWENPWGQRNTVRLFYKQDSTIQIGVWKTIKVEVDLRLVWSTADKEPKVSGVVTPIPLAWIKTTNFQLQCKLKSKLVWHPWAMTW